MKFIFYAFLMTVFNSQVFANDTNETVNKACLRQAISLVNQLKADVIDNMSQEQSDQTLKIATVTCQAYLNKELKNSELTSNSKATGDSDDEDWLTKKILSGEVERKAGNKRLMKRH